MIALRAAAVLQSHLHLEWFVMATWPSVKNLWDWNVTFLSKYEPQGKGRASEMMIQLALVGKCNCTE